MNIRMLAIAAAVAIAPGLVSAASLAPDRYFVKDLNDYRAIWTPSNSSKRLVTGGNAGRYWSFDDVVFDYQADGSASMTGRVVNVPTTNSGNNLFFDIDFQFQESAAGPNGPYCQFGQIGNCDGVDTSMWTYFSLLSGSFTGGGDMAGLTYSVTSDIGHLPQAGVGAGALNGQQEKLSFSMWFDWTLDQGATTIGKYTFNGSGDSADINVNLHPAPLPAAAWFLLAGVGGLAYAGRRRKAA
ncbi:MAG: VPLPA-CTERM sorting domain-containing protein [Pseudomonadota bacterium]